MEEKQRIIKAETNEQKEHMRAHAQELKAELQKSSADDIINPEIYGYLSIKQAGQLRRWVNQFIKANAEKEDDESIVYPFMNAKLRRAIAGVVEKMKDIEIKKQCQKIKEARENMAKTIAKTSGSVESMAECFRKTGEIIKGGQNGK